MPLVYSVEYYNFELAQQSDENQPVGSGGGKGSDEYGVIEVRQDFPDHSLLGGAPGDRPEWEASVTVTLPIT